MYWLDCEKANNGNKKEWRHLRKAVQTNYVCAGTNQSALSHALGVKKTFFDRFRTKTE